MHDRVFAQPETAERQHAKAIRASPFLVHERHMAL
jgi:hypothetical protein